MHMKSAIKIAIFYIDIPTILSVPPEERRKGGICGGGIPPEEKVRRKKGGKLALFWEN